MNALGQRTNVAQTGSAFPSANGWNWGYDSLGQVTTAENLTTPANHRAYQYDAIGNRQRAADGVLDPQDPSAIVYTANNLNQYTTVGTVSPLHDTDGNMTSGQIPAGSAGLVWDAENRLIAANITGGETVHYTYDSQSRRIARTVGTNTTLFVYDAWNIIAEYQNNTLSKTYLWGTDLSGSMQGAGGVGGLLAATDHTATGNETHFPTYDGNGNVSEYIDTTGTIAAHFEYDPFGNTIVNTDTANQFPYRFSTKPIDPTTGLYYYGYRYYNPATGRWPSRDPIEESGGMNLYGFVGNDSNNWFDAFGESRVPLFEIGGAYSVQTPEGVFFSASVSGKAEKDDSTPCCYYLTAKADFEIGIGLRLRYAGKGSIGPFGFGFGVSGEFSLAKQTFSQEINVTYCPASGSITGSGKTYVIDLDLGGNAHLSGSLTGTVGKYGSLSGSLTGSATLAGKAQGWFDVSPSTKGVKIDLLTRLYFDFAASLSGGYKVKYRGAVLSSGDIPTIGGSIFGDDRPDTGEVTLGSWSLP